MKRILALLLITSTAWAGSTTLKQIDNIQDSTGGTSVATPHAGTVFLSDTNTVTGITNKSMSGSSNTFTNIPVSAIATGTGLSVQSGGTGDTTLTINGMLFGNTTSAVGVTSAGTQYQVFQAGALGVPTVGALDLSQSAATVNQLGVAKGGTGAATLTIHGVVIGNTTGAVNVTSAGTAGQVLTSNGASLDPTFQAISSAAPALNGGSAAPESVTAAGGITLTGIAYSNFVWVVGSPGAVTVTATPSITACTADGQLLHVIGTDATKTVTLQDEASLAGTGLKLNGPWTGGLYNGLELHCDITLGKWIEDSRSN